MTSIIPKDITRSLSNITFKGKIKQSHLKTVFNLENNVFRMSKVSDTQKNIPPNLKISRNCKKISLRRNSIKTIKQSVDSLAADSDEFMARYYPKISFVENKIGRIINKY